MLNSSLFVTDLTHFYFPTKWINIVNDVKREIGVNTHFSRTTILLLCCVSLLITWNCSQVCLIINVVMHEHTLHGHVWLLWPFFNTLSQRLIDLTYCWESDDFAFFPLSNYAHLYCETQTLKIRSKPLRKPNCIINRSENTILFLFRRRKWRYQHVNRYVIVNNVLSQEKPVNWHCIQIMRFCLCSRCLSTVGKTCMLM